MNQVAAIVISNTLLFPEFVHSQGKRSRGTYLMWLECPAIARQARPGQFVMVRCGESVLPRPLSIHQVIRDRLALLYRVLDEGRGTPWLSGRPPGEGIQLLGPLGHGFEVSSSARNLLLVAGGMGIAPLYFLAQEASSRGLRTTLLMGSETSSQLYPQHLLPPGIDVFAATDDGSIGDRGLVTSLIAQHVSRADQVFACGPFPMYRDMAARKREIGLQGKPVGVSLEAVMGCGHGACYSCTIRTQGGLRQVCQDGPVFELDDVLWTEIT